MHKRTIIRTAAVVLPAIALMAASLPAFAAATNTNGFGLRERFAHLTTEQQTTLEQVHALRADGKLDEAKALAESANLPIGRRHHEPTAEHKQKMDAVRSAITANDYAQFISLIPGTPLADASIDESAFAKLVAAEKLRASGDEDGARALLAEAGLNIGRPHGGPMMRFAQLTDAQKSRLEEAKQLLDSGDRAGAKAIFDEIRGQTK